MKIIQMQFSISVTNEDFKSEEIQEMINDIKTGEFQKQLKKDSKIQKITATYHVINR